MLTAFTLSGIPEIHPGDDLATIIGDAAGSLIEGDIITVTSKIVSKAEGRIVLSADREEAITRETVRVVASKERPGGMTRIVENRLGVIGAAAGVDASNTAEGTILLLPVDPDASAARIRSALEQRFGIRLGVIITDTLGRPWRTGQTDVAIGGSGVVLLQELRGSQDTQGRELSVTAPAVGDEIAGASELLKGKSGGRPVVVVRGLSHLLDPRAAGGQILIRSAEDDLFRTGTQEAWEQGFAAGRADGGA